ncbi:MAG TPA: DUF2789 family protein [Cellvibrio sp.]|nr:DUF2789 family protein [Cellvibrio sp.]
MQIASHALSELFAQLGMNNSNLAIARFIRLHYLPPHMSIVTAPFWNSSQQHFLNECLEEDSAWCALVDQLDSRLRHH